MNVVNVVTIQIPDFKFVEKPFEMGTPPPKKKKKKKNVYIYIYLYSPLSHGDRVNIVLGDGSNARESREI